MECKHCKGRHRASAFELDDVVEGLVVEEYDLRQLYPKAGARDKHDEL
jgi:hypothetical protein